MHTDVRGNEAARGLKARAFTIGQDIVFGAGEYAPETAAGKGLLAHELTHTIQQQAHQASINAVQRQPEDAPRTGIDVPSSGQAEAGQQSYDFNVERLTEKEFQEITGLPSAILSEGDFTDARHLNISGLPEGTAPPGLLSTDQPAWLSQQESQAPADPELNIVVAASGLGTIRLPYIGPRPYTPQEMFDILANERAWSFNRGGLLFWILDGLVRRQAVLVLVDPFSL